MYNEKDRSFCALAQLTFHDRCILSMEYLIHRDTKKTSTDAGDDFQKRDTFFFNSCGFLFSAATDGKIAVWSLDRAISEWLGSQGHSLTKDEDSSLKEDSAHSVGKTVSLTSDLTACETGQVPDLTTSIEVHQSGINDIAISSITGKWH